MAGRVRCLFCPNPVGSGEHAFPEWMLKALGGRDLRLSITMPNGTIHSWKARSTKKVFKYRVVCGPCNSRWMSQLENHSGTYVVPMMRGDLMELDATAQTLLSMWALKTAMVFDAVVRGGPHFFRQQEREQLARSMTPPSPTQNPFAAPLRVWLAHYQGARGTDFWGLVGHGIGRVTNGPHQPPVDVPVSAYFATLAAGQFVMQVMFPRVPVQHKRTAWGNLVGHPSKDFSRFTRQICPVVTSLINWPRVEILQDAGMSLDDFAKRWPHGAILRT